jgi:hypothetical protein
MGATENGDTGISDARDSVLVRRAINAAIAGKLEACQFLYVRFAPEAHQELLRFPLGPERTAVVLAEIFSGLATSITRYDRGASPSFEGWIRALARMEGARVAYDPARRRDLPTIVLPSQSGSPGESTIGSSPSLTSGTSSGPPAARGGRSVRVRPPLR